MQGMAREHQHGRGLLTKGEASLTLQFSGGTPPTVPVWKLWHKDSLTSRMWTQSTGFQPHPTSPPHSLAPK